MCARPRPWVLRGPPACSFKIYCPRSVREIFDRETDCSCLLGARIELGLLLQQKRLYTFLLPPPPNIALQDFSALATSLILDSLSGNAETKSAIELRFSTAVFWLRVTVVRKRVMVSKTVMFLYSSLPLLSSFFPLLPFRVIRPQNALCKTAL